MARHYHINGGGTNLTSNQIAGVTTTPVNAVPSISVPFYAAFDATNINGHYEEVEITGKTATNINHAATAYAHTTAEEVRFPFVATESDYFSAQLNGAAPISLQAPQGFLINGKIEVTDASGITATLKTLAGTDPSSTDPIYIRIGNTIRTITAATTAILADGTNWFNAGSAELATKEIDYFAYAVYDSNSSVVALTFARIPSASLVSDFSATTTNEKHCANYANFTSTDEVELIGRFAATLSAGAGYTWSVPTYTAANLIQRPIYESRWLTWTPTISTGGTAPTYTTDYINRYRIVSSNCDINCEWSNDSGGTAGSGAGFTITIPFSVSSNFASAANRGCVAVGNSYESAGTICGIVLQRDSATGKTPQVANITTGVALGGDAQSSISRYIAFRGLYEI